MHVSRMNIRTSDGVDGAVFHLRNPSDARFGLHTQQRNLKGGIGYSAAADIVATPSKHISGAGDGESGNQSAMWTVIVVVVFIVFLSGLGIFFYKTIIQKQREAVVRARESRNAPRQPRTEQPRVRTRARARTQSRTQTPPIQPYVTEPPVIDRCSETVVESDDDDDDDDSLGMDKA